MPIDDVDAEILLAAEQKCAAFEPHYGARSEQINGATAQANCQNDNSLVIFVSGRREKQVLGTLCQLLE